MTRMIHCKKLDKELPGLLAAPFKGDFGARIYAEISQEGWALWLQHSTMVINEYRLNPAESEARKVLRKQMEDFFFGNGGATPSEYVAPTKAS